MSKRLSGKIVIVTGAASGLGAAAARRMHAEGAVVILTDRDVERGAAVAQGLGCTFKALDVTDEAAWIAVVDAVIDTHGRLDGLVNNAGIGLPGSIEDTTLEAFRFVHRVNVDGTFLGCKHAVRVMKGCGGGSIVNVSSVAGILGAPNLAAYSSSKGAVRTLTKSVAVHCAKKGYGIRCNSLHPAFIATPMVDAMVSLSKDPVRAREGLARGIPLGRIGEPDDVAAAVAYLVSDDAKFITGVELPIDGGLLAQ